MSEIKVQMNNETSLDPLQISLKWLKEWKREQPPHQNEMNLPHTVFWLVLSGNITMEFDRVEYELTAGDIVCLPKQTPFRWGTIQNGIPFHYLSLACEARLQTFDLLKMYRFPVVYHVTAGETFQRLIEHWFQTAEQFSQLVAQMPQHAESDFIVMNTNQTTAYLESLMLGAQWFHLLFRILQPSLPAHPSAYDLRVFTVCNYLKHHLHKRPSLDELADLVNISKQYLRILFIKELDISPMKYGLQLRMERACELLALTSKPMKEISEALGYIDQHHFTKDFRRLMNMSPTSYRGRNNSLL